MSEWDELARYNSECYRGVIHTPEMDARMAKEQASFNIWIANRPFTPPSRWQRLRWKLRR